MSINLKPECPLEINDALLMKTKLAFVFRELTEKLYVLAFHEENIFTIKNQLQNILLKIDIPYNDNSNWSDPYKIIEKFNYASSPYIKSDYFSKLESMLTETHSGNCTGQAWSCDRCTVEEMLDFSTVTWNKNDGNIAANKTVE